MALSAPSSHPHPAGHVFAREAARTHGPAAGPRAGNDRLACLLIEAGFSRKGFARAVQAEADAWGDPVSVDHTSVTRWLNGSRARPGTAEHIAAVLSARLDRDLTPAAAGLAPDHVVDADQRPPRQPNTLLADLIDEAGLTRKAFVRAVRAHAAASGDPLNVERASVSRWLNGATARPGTTAHIAAALSVRLGRQITPEDTGLAPITEPATHPADETSAAAEAAVASQVQELRVLLEETRAQLQHLVEAVGLDRDLTTSITTNLTGEPTEVDAPGPAVLHSAPVELDADQVPDTHADDDQAELARADDSDDDGWGL